MSRGAVTDIHQWLEQSGLQKYADAFSEHEITLEVLAALTELDFDKAASNWAAAPAAGGHL